MGVGGEEKKNSHLTGATNLTLKSANLTLQFKLQSYEVAIFAAFSVAVPSRAQPE